MIPPFIICENCNGKHKKMKNYCSIHAFVMKNTNPTVKYQQQVNMSFCPILNPSKCIYQNIIPYFNSDGKSYFPSFTLETDADYMKFNQYKYIQDYQRLLYQSQLDDFSIYQPKPNIKTPFCAICKLYYQEYRQHIQTDTHRNMIKKNKYNDLMIKMCNQMKGSVKRKKSTKQIDKKPNYQIIQISSGESVTADEQKIRS